MDYDIREIEEKEVVLLREMLYEAVYWRPGGPRPEMEAGLADPALAKLLADWGRAGDAAVVAVTAAGERIGAGWYRFWSDADRSYGYVDAATPELGIAVVGEHRGRGVGGALLRALFDLARQRGVERISLSVEQDNPARHLYVREGFERVETVENAWTMVRSVGSS